MTPDLSFRRLRDRAIPCRTCTSESVQPVAHSLRGLDYVDYVLGRETRSRARFFAPGYDLDTTFLANFPYLISFGPRMPSEKVRFHPASLNLGDRLRCCSPTT